jgi:hypothetical protein
MYNEYIHPREHSEEELQEDHGRLAKMLDYIEYHKKKVLKHMSW